jgi:hypothetical protein
VALLGSDGFGIVAFDMEDYIQARDDDRLRREAVVHFTSLDQCTPATRAAMLPHIDQLLGAFLDELAIRGLID